MLNSVEEQSFALIITEDRLVEIEIGPRFTDGDVELAVASVHALSHVVSNQN